MKNMKLEDLGYGDFFAGDGGQEGFLPARIVAQHKDLYRAVGAGGEYRAKITGKQMFGARSERDYPAVGDWVEISDLGEGQAVIHRVLPRKTIIKRRRGKDEVQIIAANIDAAFIVESVDGDYNLNRLERYFALARDGGIEPIIILNKTDLIPREELEEKTSQIKNRLGAVELVGVSALAGGGLDELKAKIVKGKTYCFLGSSGVGKSTIINKLLGKKIMKTGEIDARTDRGRHTTMVRQIHFLENGGIVIDNPGMREVGMADCGEGIDDLFGEIAARARECKYTDCTHTNEPGCAVRAAIESGRLDEEKYQNYSDLKKEADFYEMSEIEKKRKDRDFGKFIKQTKIQLKRGRHKNF